MKEFDAVSLQVMWSRLFHIADMMWTTVLRTAVSTVIAAAHDFGCAITDARGRSLAHDHTGMFSIALGDVTQEVLRKYPAETIKPGDVFLTNDPYLCAGHLPDTAIVTPIFYQRRLVGFATNIANVVDIGGLRDKRPARDSYEEGIFFPICKLFDGGEPNELVFDMFRWNVRAPDMVLNDIEAQLSANEVASRYVREFLEEYSLEDMESLSDVALSRSEETMRQAISQVRDGEYSGEVYTDGVGTPLRLAVKVIVKGDELSVDFTGSSPQVEQGGINCTFTHTRSVTYLSLAQLLTPEVPANEGSFRPFKVYAPEATIMNSKFPAPVDLRVWTSSFIHGAIFRAMSQVLPDNIQADNGLLTAIRTYGVGDDGKEFDSRNYCGGGRGGTSAGDGGMNTGPSSIGCVPVEVFEQRSPALVMAKEFIQDSPGAGKYQGGPGLRLVISKLPSQTRPLDIYLRPRRMVAAPQGIFGGHAGTKTRIIVNDRVLSDDPVRMKQGYVTLEGNEDKLTLECPSGGGMHEPKERDPALVMRDVRDGLVSPEKAKAVYGMDDTSDPRRTDA